MCLECLAMTSRGFHFSRCNTFRILHFIWFMLRSDWSVYRNTSLLWLSMNVRHVFGIRIFLIFFANFKRSLESWYSSAACVMRHFCNLPIRAQHLSTKNRMKTQQGVARAEMEATATDCVEGPPSRSLTFLVGPDRQTDGNFQPWVTPKSFTLSDSSIFVSSILNS